MALGVPVVAYSSTAVTETAGGAALLLDDKSPMALSTAVHRVLADGSLRGRLVEAGAARADEFSLDRGRQRWAGAIDEAVATAGASAP
jgi:glycosyltransferase involved in cell wall biosynthesis